MNRDLQHEQDRPIEVIIKRKPKEETPKHKNKNVWFTPYHINRIIMMAVLIAVLFKFCFIGLYYLNYVPSGSMESTIKTGDAVLSINSQMTIIQRGDIVVMDVRDHGKTTPMIKRVIGLPGETVNVTEGKVYINGKALDEPYIKEPMNTSGDGKFQVPKDSYFVMGDNRNNSYDSRFWDNPYIHRDQIKQKALLIFAPFWRINYIA